MRVHAPVHVRDPQAAVHGVPRLPYAVIRFSPVRKCCGPVCYCMFFEGVRVGGSISVHLQVRVCQCGRSCSRVHMLAVTCGEK